MTNEEAIEILENWNLCHYTPSREAAEAVISALDPLEIITALRPVSREQVEKVWRGEWEMVSNGKGICSKCHRQDGIDPLAKFCRYCGAPITDEAVEMVMKRLETLNEM